MVATVYTPNGIVVATASYDSFHEHLDTEDGIQISPINIEGLTHTYLFYNKYSLTFNGLNSYTMNRLRSLKSAVASAAAKSSRHPKSQINSLMSRLQPNVPSAIPTP